ncbi:unnamed protein product [Fusarium equiseti]|uniref:Uncharacterized protein n=1 Tax=Fusarium equiseti TaxID=61235 RepID=A0A8J2ILZ6_FUSEQ|nr:unnamed protein product [Fusarium equiseti]
MRINIANSFSSNPFAYPLQQQLILILRDQANLKSKLLKAYPNNTLVESPHLHPLSSLTSHRKRRATAIMSTLHLEPRMNNIDTDVFVACICAMIFIIFIGVVVYFAWRPGPEPRSDTSDTNSHDDEEGPDDRRPSDAAGCNLPWFRRRQTSLERNTYPLESVPGTAHPRDGVII